MNWFTADWHLGDNREFLFRPDNFTEIISDNIRDIYRYTQKDKITLYMLGDVFPKHIKSEEYEREFKNALIHFEHIIERLKSQNVYTILIMGNHDIPYGREFFLKYFDEVHEDPISLQIKDIDVELRHYLDQPENEDLFAVVGHVHSIWSVCPRAVNVGVDVNFGRPISEDMLYKKIKAATEFYGKDNENDFPYFRELRPVEEGGFEEIYGEMIGYSEEWIDEDVNPEGIRICCHSDAGWASARWCSYHDCYEHFEDEDGDRPLQTPTHWAPLPKFFIKK